MYRADINYAALIESAEHAFTYNVGLAKTARHGMNKGQFWATINYRYWMNTEVRSPEARAAVEHLIQDMECVYLVERKLTDGSSPA